MNSDKRALLLIGSPKIQSSTSESLGTYLIHKLEALGFESNTFFIHKSLKPDDRKQALLAAVDRAELIIMSFPLYVDSIPYLTIKLLEIIAENRGQREESTARRLVCLVNSGFPEAHQNDTALAICRQFARETGFHWAGGLQLGGGEAIGGRPLLEVKGMARNVIKSLDLAAAALAEGNPVPPQAEN